MTWIESLGLFLLLASTVACASPKIGYDYDPHANFTTYQTYAWVVGPQEQTGDKRIDNRLVDSRIRNTIETQLRSKGYAVSANTQPDFYVAYHIGVKDMTKGSSTQHYIGDFAHGTYTTTSDIQPYKEGGLLIDIVDAASKQLAWRGSGVAEVDPGMAPEERDELINQVVRAMFSHFPPQ